MADHEFTAAEIHARVADANRRIDPEFWADGRAKYPFIILKPDDHTRACWINAVQTIRQGRESQDAEIIALAAIALYDTDTHLCTCREPQPAN
ncbi:hypothetical protein D1871_04020 [Nakamurella silvestris]|nr:hypothetical protein D1871_04020 [Nakamurella silvestris]